MRELRAELVERDARIARLEAALAALTSRATDEGEDDAPRTRH